MHSSRRGEVYKRGDGRWRNGKLSGGQHTAQSRHQPTHLSCPGHFSGRADDCRRRRCATLARGSRTLPRQTRCRAPARQLSVVADEPGRAGLGDLRPAPGAAGRRAGFGSVQGRGGRQPAAPRPSGTSPLNRGTPGATARPAPALGFRLPPGLLNFGGRKSRPQVASRGEALHGRGARVGWAGAGAGPPRGSLSHREGGNWGPRRFPPRPSDGARGTGRCPFVVHLFADCPLCARL